MPNVTDLIAEIQDSQRTLFIMCGLPYSGKSFVAEELRQKTYISYVSIDDIFRTRGYDWSTNTLPDAEAWQKIFDESYRLTKALLEQNLNVLYDSTNQTLASRDALQEVAESVGAETRVIYIESSKETVWKRWNENKNEPTRSVVGEELVQMTIDMFEAPNESENVIVIKN